MGQSFPFSLFGGGSGSSSPTVSADGLTYAYSGFKPGTSASLFDVTAGGAALSTQTVNGAGKVTFTLASKPPTGNSIVIDGQQRISAGKVASSGGGTPGVGPVLRLIMWGQSNAQALGTETTATNATAFNTSQVLPTGYTGPNARVKIWGASNAFETYQPYVNSEQGSNPGNTWGSEWAIASAWLSDNPTGTVYIVKHTVGSTGLAVGSSANVWAPSAGQLYTALTNKVVASNTAASAQGITFNAANTVVVQSQGEQDARTSTDAGNYQSNLQAFIAQARTDWSASRWIIERLHVEMTLSGFVAGWSTVYAAQNAVIAADANVELVSTDGLPLGDGLHFTAASCDAKGIRTGAIVTRWWTKGSFGSLSNLIDANNDRYARAVTAGDVTTMKSCLAADVLLCTTTATTARTYIDIAGVRRNNLAANTLRFDWSGGKRRLVHEAQAQNALLYSRDLTNPVWVAINITAAKDQTGLDGVANSASRITATANGGTILQSVTVAAGARTKSLDIKRLAGTGTIEATLDGNAYVVISGFDANGIARVPLPSQTLAAGTVNVGFRIATSGDSFLIDATQFETGTFATSPIYTAGSAVIRAAEKITPVVQTDAQGAAGTFVYRGRGAVSTAAQFIGGDNGNAVMGRTTLATRLTQSNGSATLNADTTGTPYVGSFGIANTFDATGRRLCINGGAVASDANAETARTNGITIGANSSTNALSQTGGQCDLVGWGSTLSNDNALQGLAVAA